MTTNAKRKDITEVLFDLLNPGRELPPSQHIRDALLDSSDERIRLEAEHEAAHNKAMDPLVSEGDAEAASDRANVLDRKITRLERAEEHLRELLDRAYAAEKKAELDKSAAAARNAIEGVQARFLNRYPVLVAELLELLSAVKDVREFVSKVNRELQAVGEPAIYLPPPLGTRLPSLPEAEIGRERVTRWVAQRDERVLPDDVVDRGEVADDGRLRLAWKDDAHWGKWAVEKEFDAVTYLPTAYPQELVDVLAKIAIPGHWHKGERVQPGRQLAPLMDPALGASCPVEDAKNHNDRGPVDNRSPLMRLEAASEIEPVTALIGADAVVSEPTEDAATAEDN